MFLVNVKEAFGYTHEQTLDSSYTTIQNMLTEYSYMLNERNLASNSDANGDDFEWVDLPDFNDPTKTNRFKKYRDVGGKIGDKKE